MAYPWFFRNNSNVVLASTSWWGVLAAWYQPLPLYTEAFVTKYRLRHRTYYAADLDYLHVLGVKGFEPPGGTLAYDDVDPEDLRSPNEMSLKRFLNQPPIDLESLPSGTLFVSLDVSGAEDTPWPDHASPAGTEPSL